MINLGEVGYRSGQTASGLQYNGQCASPDGSINESANGLINSTCGSMGPGHAASHMQETKRQRTAYTRHQILELGKNRIEKD
jgi:hypothetical protein